MKNKQGLVNVPENFLFLSLQPKFCFEASAVQVQMKLYFLSIGVKVIIY